jgi:hypothetical protein
MMEHSCQGMGTSKKGLHAIIQKCYLCPRTPVTYVSGIYIPRGRGLSDKMIIRHLALCVVLLTNAFAQNGALSTRVLSAGELRTSSAFAQQRSLDLRTSRAFAQKKALDTSGFDSSYRLSLPNPLQDKNFFLLSLFQRTRDVSRLLSQDKVLKELAHDKLLALKKSDGCRDVTCFEALIRFDDFSLAAVANELQHLAEQPEFKLLAKRDLRPSGVFIKYREMTDAQMLVAAWKDAAAGLNRILKVYCLGKDPRYPVIDKVSFDVSTEAYRNLLKTKIAEIRFSNDALFFEPTLNFDLKLLEINRRDEAARYEPLEAGENRAAVQNLTNIKWSD